MIRRHALKSVLAASAITATLVLGALPGHAGDAALTDGAIFAIYNQVNSMDIETALLGEMKGNAEDVRALGRMVSGDHTGVRKAAHELAVAEGIVAELPGSRMEAAQTHYDVIEGLREKSGEAFDAAYLRHEIAFHEAAIDAVKTVLIPATQNAELKAHFEAVLPHFQHHLDETRRVAKELGIE